MVESVRVASPFGDRRSCRPAPKAKPKKKAKPTPDGPALFELPEEVPTPRVASSQSTASDLVAQVSGSPTIRDEFAKLRIRQDEFEWTLQVLINNGGTAMSADRIIAIANVDARRPDRYFTQLQRLLNQDGVEVLSVTSGEVTLDVATLKTQLELS